MARRSGDMDGHVEDGRDEVNAGNVDDGNGDTISETRNVGPGIRSRLEGNGEDDETTNNETSRSRRDVEKNGTDGRAGGRESSRDVTYNFTGNEKTKIRSIRTGIRDDRSPKIDATDGTTNRICIRRRTTNGDVKMAGSTGSVRMSLKGTRSVGRGDGRSCTGKAGNAMNGCLTNETRYSRTEDGTNESGTSDGRTKARITGSGVIKDGWI